MYTNLYTKNTQYIKDMHTKSIEIGLYKNLYSGGKAKTGANVYYFLFQSVLSVLSRSITGILQYFDANAYSHAQANVKHKISWRH